MAVKKVTRRKVNDPIVDSALTDVYNKLDKLQPRSTKDNYSNSNLPEEGTMTTVETSEGTVSSAVFTNNGWLVDINSNYQRIGTSGFISAFGVNGRSKKPVKGEALSYNRDGNVEIGNSQGDKTLIKNEGGVIKFRNQVDGANADIQCANVRDANGNKSIEIDAASSAINHLKMKNSATGDTIELIPAGNDSNVAIQIASKGTGNVFLKTSHANGAIQWLSSSGAVKFSLDPNDEKFTIHDSGVLTANIETTGYAETRFYNLDASSATSQSHIKISAADDLYLAAGGKNIYLYGGGTGQNGASFDMGSIFGSLQPEGGSYLTHTATATSTGYKVDSNLSGTGASDGTGLQIDFDRTVAGSGTAAHNDIGIDLDVNSASLGTSSVKGMDIDVVGATSGTHTATGIELNVSGADTNEGLVITNADGGKDIVLKSSVDTADYFYISTTASGNTTIATVDDGAAAAHLNIEPDGHVEFDNCGVGFDLGTPTYHAVNATIDFRLGNKQFYTFDGGSTTNALIYFPKVSGNLPY